MRPTATRSPRPATATRRTLAAVAAGVLVLAACGGDEPADDPAPTTGDGADDAPEPPTDDAVDGDTTDGSDDEGADDGATAPPEPTGDEVEVTTTDVATGLEAPWDVAFLGDRAFVTERDLGRVVEVTGDGSLTEVRSFDVVADGEAGLLGLTAGPDDLLYAYYTATDGNRVVRFAPDATDEPEVVLDGIPANTTHDGGRLVFGPDGMLYVGTGDAQDAEAAQDPSSLAGKILRVTPDGDVPDDGEAETAVWSLGHRNVQGLAFDADGALFASEFGPDRDDEINRVEAGTNHGWPDVTGEAGVDGFADPVLVRQPDEASWTGATVLDGGAIPQWEGDLFVAALRGERLFRVPLDDGEVGEPDELHVGEFGRLRHVEQAPDGSLWLLTNNTDGRGSPADGDDRIVRIGPA